VINQQLVNELPLNGRNFVQLANPQSGSDWRGRVRQWNHHERYGGRTTAAPAQRSSPTVNREGDNNFLYDGVDNNERLTLSVTLRPPVDAIREFRFRPTCTAPT